MNVSPSYHVGRAWSGHEIEDECPCPQQACGLVAMCDINHGCAQHGATKTIRQGHPAVLCPGAPDDEETP